jgi:hypothetical protein
MASSSEAERGIPAAVGLLRSLWRLLASLKLAVISMIALGVVLAWGTFLEAARGREYAQWFVYGRTWFIALWGLLGVNILAAMLIRFPWKARHLGFLITHVGLLVLLVGALQTLLGGIEGRLAFLEGETADSILIADRSQLTVFPPIRRDIGDAPPMGGQHGQKSTDFSFSGGPVDWPPGKTLDFGTSGGLGVKVLKFYRHALAKADWVAIPPAGHLGAHPDGRSGGGGPAVKLALSGPDGKPVVQSWLPTDQLSTTISVGPVRFQLHEVSADSMLEDFRRPPGGTSERPDRWQGKDGVLSMHYEGKMYRVPVHQKVGQKIPLGETGVLVEIVKYLPNARVGPKVQFTSEGDEPNNPLLDLLVYLPGEDKPLRQLAFAKAPFLTLDGVHGRRCPVRFWYHHPAVAAEPGAELLQTPDGRLYCRVGVEGAYQWRGEVHEGDQINIAGNLKLSILKYIPHARQEVTFQPVELAAGERQGPEAAALVEVSTPGAEPQQVWLRRDDQVYGFQRIPTPQGPLLVSLGYEYLRLNFSLKLLDFRRGLNPGKKGDASFSSSVQLMDPGEKSDQRREISMNKPLSHGKFTFYQSSFQELPDGRQASILSVACDPGRIAKYSGCLMICVGTFVMFYVRRPFARKAPPSASHNPTAGHRPEALVDDHPPSEEKRGRSATVRSSSATDRPTGTGYAKIG